VAETCECGFFYKNLFARDLNTYTSVPESTKIVPVQPIYMQNTRCARGHVAPSSGDGRCSSEKIVTKEKTLQQTECGYESSGSIKCGVFLD
jgi:hypothetical protein